MIKKFYVNNVKGFENFEFDLSKTREYTFNKHQVKNGLINKGIIYGKNGSGKSNLGLAMHDIVYHLTDNKLLDLKYINNYLNLKLVDKEAEFNYTFLFDDIEYTYKYKKTAFNVLTYEEIQVNDQTVLMYDFLTKEYEIKIEGLETLRIDLMDSRMSIVKYIYNNSISAEKSPISLIVKFVSGMLWFRCLVEGNSFIGATPNYATLDDFIIENNKINDFEIFLRENGLDYKLEKGFINGRYSLMARFEKGIVPLSSIISTGTQALWLYYSWSISFDKVKFLFLDEFDAFYHYETAELIFKLIDENKDLQSFVTTHNTYLMKNEFIRPDTCLILSNNKINSLSNCTKKEIREAHNLEKLYINDAFNE
ncbi:MAG: AAA family ATPase [bacterium]